MRRMRSCKRWEMRAPASKNQMKARELRAENEKTNRDVRHAHNDVVDGIDKEDKTENVEALHGLV